MCGRDDPNMKNRYKVGSIVTGCVTGIEKYGIFVSLDSYYSGLIHISEVSDSFVKNLNDYVSIGETIKVKVLEIDDYNCHAKLSIKGFNYRKNHKNRRMIKETVHGFSTLETNLNMWINKKNKEIANKIKKI